MGDFAFHKLVTEDGREFFTCHTCQSTKCHLIEHSEGMVQIGVRYQALCHGGRGRGRDQLVNRNVIFPNRAYLTTFQQETAEGMCPRCLAAAGAGDFQIVSVDEQGNRL